MRLNSRTLFRTNKFLSFCNMLSRWITLCPPAVALPISASIHSLPSVNIFLLLPTSGCLSTSTHLVGYNAQLFLNATLS